MRKQDKTAGALDSRAYAILLAIDSLECYGEEATYNKLYEATKNLEKMPRQTFQKRLKQLVDAGLVERHVKKESKLTYKPSVYQLTKKGRIVVALNHSLVSLRAKLIEEMDSASLSHLYSFFISRMGLAASCSPLFTFLGHGHFLEYFCYDLMYLWCEILKKRSKEKPEEFLEVLAQSLAMTTVISGEPLPEEAIEEIKNHLKKNGIDPELVFQRAEEYKKASDLALCEFEKRLTEEERS